jgi:hypothetical protein
VRQAHQIQLLAAWAGIGTAKERSFNYAETQETMAENQESL